MFDWSRQLRIQRAAQLLHTGGVIAYPTEAVWGLGADPFNSAAVDRLLALKQRSIDKGLIIVAANIEQLESYLLTLSSQQREQLETSWPGPITWLVPNNNMFPPWICGRYTKVALRVSRHPVVQSLCLAFGGPIVSTSANHREKLNPGLVGRCGVILNTALITIRQVVSVGTNEPLKFATCSVGKLFVAVNRSNTIHINYNVHT